MYAHKTFYKQGIEKKNEKQIDTNDWNLFSKAAGLNDMLFAGCMITFKFVLTKKNINLKTDDNKKNLVLWSFRSFWDIAGG